MRIKHLAFGALLTLGLTLSSCAPQQDAPATPIAEVEEVTEPVSDETVSNSEPAEMPNEGEKTVESHEGQVLRHAVFFKFKDDVPQEQIDEVVQAFRDLPNKIPEIIGFQWGVNNSPEGFDAGFTHAFLLTFADEAGRAAYLPHEAHKAFGQVLSGKNEKVFVIDYWGTPYEPLEKELKHCVFFKFKEDASPEDIHRIEEGFAELRGKISAIKGYEWGINNSPEKHDAGFTHCFMVTFDSEEGRDEYLPHPDHKAFVEVLLPLLEEPRVIDFLAEGPLTLSN
ncbi:MAG: Dabb family protein [Planctomycetaceae bacterium]|nr:Dabb family protein [Planctomycetaceae bacterium]